MINATYLDPVYHFLSGAVCMGAWACGLFFFRSWWRSGDRLFGFFGLSFWLMTLERLLLLFTGQRGEEQPLIYLLRLVAFLVILLGIWDKNRAHAPKKKPAYGT